MKVKLEELPVWDKLGKFWKVHHIESGLSIKREGNIFTIEILDRENEVIWGWGSGSLRKNETRRIAFLDVAGKVIFSVSEDNNGNVTFVKGE